MVSYERRHHNGNTRRLTLPRRYHNRYGGPGEGPGGPGGPLRRCDGQIHRGAGRVHGAEGVRQP